MYATWKYFGSMFGTPDAVEVTRDADDDDDTLQCAPTDTNGPVIRRGFAPGINAWCDSLELDYVTQDDTRREKVWSFSGTSPGTKSQEVVYSANWIKDVKGEGCPERTRGTEPKDCKTAMYEVLDSCGFKDGMETGSPRYGGSNQGEGQCVVWKIEIIDYKT
jgi:hypothetical protein